MTEKRLAAWGIGLAVGALTVVGAASGWNPVVVLGLPVVGLLAIAAVFGLLRKFVFKTKLVELHGEIGSEVVNETSITGLPGAAGIYAFVHSQLAGDDPRTVAVKIKLQDDVVEMVRENAFATPVDDADVTRVLAAGSPAERVLVFGLLQAAPQLVTVDRLVQGIEFSQSGNEQYHALLATTMRWPAFTEQERARLRDTVVRAPYLREDPDRAVLADQLIGPAPAA